ncbi:hypothetical protein [Paenibacillus popilliae]|uniref:YfjL-like N-terminal domain-containing protein n=1 Tax=Paenibacillus popilliae TaxID=78057 RepID=A0ABY3ARU4_PAEPP|nr:hypothetical protein [Paenibacillus sp. SDF0028]TQR45514.1 hypothetical protein C7Y44_07120 [Paenibacillus sp. SDF0028]
MVFINRSADVLLLLVVLLLVGSSMYFGFTGTPWGKSQFKNIANEYIQNNFPNLDVSKHTVLFHFKESDYYSVISLKNGVTFKISRVDEEIFDENGQSVVDIVGNFSRISNFTEPRFIELKDKLNKDYSKILIHTNSDLLSNETTYRKVFQLLQKLKYKEYLFKLVFFDKNNSSKIIVDHDNINDINSLEDLKSILKFN